MADAALQSAPLPVGSAGRNGVGWWGVLTLIATEAALFAYLLFSYYYFAAHAERSWFPAKLPEFKLSGPNTIILLLSSVAVWFGERGARKENRRQNLLGLLVASLLGVAFLAIQIKEWGSQSFSLQSSSYGSLFFVITGFHMAHVVAGVIVLIALLICSGLGYFDRRHSAPVMIGSLYWHFVDAVWLSVFFSLYVAPRLWW